jgi:hypothetical protein
VVLPVPVASRDPEAVCALAALYERTGSFAQAYALLGECNAVASWFLPAVAARGCVALRGDDWVGAWEAAVVLLEGEGDNVEGHRLATLCVMVREGPGVRAWAGRRGERGAMLSVAECGDQDVVGRRERGKTRWVVRALAARVRGRGAVKVDKEKKRMGAPEIQ